MKNIFGILLVLSVSLAACDQDDGSKTITGSEIVFHSYRDGNYNIYVMNTDGSLQTRLTDNSSEDTNPCWSPDGSKIVFTRSCDENYQMYIMNADGANQTNLSNDEHDDSFPDWRDK